MAKAAQRKAIIYCRAASGTREDVARSLAAQEARCTLFANANGYSVIARFDDHASGRDADRAGHRSMMQLIAQSEDMSVIIDTVSALARDPLLHMTLMAQISGRGSRVIDRAATQDPNPNGFLLQAISLAVQP